MAPISVTDLPVLDDLCLEDATLSPLIVSTDRGFLPRMNPISKLPPEFERLEILLEQMPVITASGHAGLLSTGSLGEVVDLELPNLLDAVQLYKQDLAIMTALFRDYTFVASAYLLEPCHLRSMQGKEFGLGRQTLPAQIAQPLCLCAELAGFKPYLEYAGSYVLSNFRLQDPKLGIEMSNLRLIRAFERGLSPESSEAGFVRVHINMVKHSAPLVQGVVTALRATENSALSPDSRVAFNDGLFMVVEALKNINTSMKQMFAQSRPTEFNNFRTFMFGITSQFMFPNGVVYQGVNENKPMFFRGLSAANDSMIPVVDRLLDISMPNNPLTNILRDFDQYRPAGHREFLKFVKEYSAFWGVKSMALDLRTNNDNKTSTHEYHLLRVTRSLWLQILNEVRLFRWRHWGLTKEYILKRSEHPAATGGSPITSWLPNQLEAVLEEMISLYESCMEEDPQGLGQVCQEFMEQAVTNLQVLKKEVAKFCSYC